MLRVLTVAGDGRSSGVEGIEGKAFGTDALGGTAVETAALATAYTLCTKRRT